MLQPTKVRRSSSRRVVSLALVVLGLAAIWSVAWWIIAGKAEELITAALVREADRGRALTCRKRSIAGYPFRLDFVCEDAKLEVRAGRTYFLTSPHVVAMAQVYRPRHIILAAASPLQVDWMGGGEGEPEDRHQALLTFDTLGASVVRGADGPERLSVEAHNLAAALTRQAQRSSMFARADLELHIRQSPNARPPGSYDIAGKLTALEVPILDAILKRGASLTLEGQGAITRIDALRQGSRSERAKAWQTAGGALHLEFLKAERSGMRLEARGDLELDAEGFISGNLPTKVAGAAELGKTLKDVGLAPEKTASLLRAGLLLVGKQADIDGKPAIEVDVTLAKGKIRAGPLPLGKAPRLFRPAGEPSHDESNLF